MERSRLLSVGRLTVALLLSVITLAEVDFAASDASLSLDINRTDGSYKVSL